MGILIALPVAATGKPDVLSLGLAVSPVWPGLVLMTGLAIWLWTLSRRDASAT